MAHEKKASGSSSNLTSALSEAQSIIEAAEQRAAELRSDAEKTFQEARGIGYSEGFEEGRRDAVHQAIRLVEESTAISEALSEEAARLAVAISETIVGEHISLNPKAVKKIAVAAIQEAVTGDSVTLVVNPEDEAVLKKSLSDFRRIAGGASVAIESDPALSRGGCIVQTDFGEVDASLPALLDSIADRLGLKKK